MNKTDISSKAHMTVIELREKLSQFPDRLIVMIPNSSLHLLPEPIWYVPAKNVSIGVNESDCLLFIDGYEEEDE